MGMSNNYKPPFEISNEMQELVFLIIEKVGNLFNVGNLDRIPKLRKANRIKSIQSSLAIESNSLTYEQVSDIIDNKDVVGPKDDIIAVKNAIEAYNEIENIDPYNVNDLLKLHGIMMKDLVKEPGKIRTQQVGVYDENRTLVHRAPSYKLVDGLLKNLFDWLKSSNDFHILIKSSIFHYEFEFIHPFVDGNGRMGRLFQTALLSKWRPIFLWIPIESIIKEHQREYYYAITQSNNEGKSNTFVLFMLRVINKAIDNLLTETNDYLESARKRVSSLLQVMDTYAQSADVLMKKLNLKSRLGFRKNYLDPALELGVIKMTVPDKPRSKNQKYYKAISLTDSSDLSSLETKII